MPNMYLKNLLQTLCMRTGIVVFADHRVKMRTGAGAVIGLETVLKRLIPLSVLVEKQYEPNSKSHLQMLDAVTFIMPNMNVKMFCMPIGIVGIVAQTERMQIGTGAAIHLETVLNRFKPSFAQVEQLLDRNLRSHLQKEDVVTSTTQSMFAKFRPIQNFKVTQMV